MPARNRINLATVEIDLITEINNSNGATMLMNPSTLVTTSNLVAELEKIAGLEFGGNIQDIGNKTRGKFYYDNVTKFYYECIEDNSLTYNDSGKFRPISNKPISDKVENLCKSEILTAASFAGYFANYNKSEWFVPLPSHINIRKIIAVTCFNLMTTSEYANLDYNDNVIRVGGDGNLKDLAINTIKVLVTYNA